MKVKPEETIPSIFLETVERLGNNIAMRQKKFGLWQDISWSDYRKNARTVAMALLHLGVKKGDFIGIIGDNCPEWLYIDMGTQMCGGVSVGIYTTSAAEQCEYIVNHAGCTILFVENEEQLDKWLHFRNKSPQVKKVIVWDWKGLNEFSDNQVMRYEDFLTLAETGNTDSNMTLTERISALRSDDLSVLIYTSGTTGPPKGAMLSHGNMAWMSSAIANVQENMMVSDKDEVLSFLPLCHIFERMYSIMAHIRIGYVVNFIENLDTVAENLREVSPTIGYAVPRIWEKYHARINLGILEANWFKRYFAHYAINQGIKFIQRRIDQMPIRWTDRLLRLICEHFLYKHLRRHLGMERMKFALSGAAPIAPDVLQFFNAIGLKILEGYGQTESGGVTTCVRLGSYSFGSVGPPLKGIEVKLSDESEIMVKSPAVFMGYYHNDEATKSTLKDGWLYSGDIGTIQEDGSIVITDRKKDLIITAGGKNIAPQYIENRIKCSPFINDAIVIGEKRKFVSALIVLDEENITKYTQDHKIVYQTYSDLAENGEIRALIQNEIDKVNKQVSRVESVRRFAILPKRLYQEDGDVTPTMKVKRATINKNYEELIESMYH
jgi:long-chain acyl-CoA synthetase